MVPGPESLVPKPNFAIDVMLNLMALTNKPGTRAQMQIAIEQYLRAKQARRH
jgi:hypothetical protein